jgi:hypothetical protein
MEEFPVFKNEKVFLLIELSKINLFKTDNY